MYVFYVGVSLDIENSVFYHFRTRMFPGNLWPAVENDEEEYICFPQL
jgi:hypothetical protein